MSKAERLQWEAAVTREAVNGEVQALPAQGVLPKVKARTTGLSRQTIRKIVRGQRHDVFRTRQSSLDPWRVRLEAEWNGGRRVGAELRRRLRASGFAGSLRVVGEWTTRRRRDDRFGPTAGPSSSARTIARGLTVERDLMDRFHTMMWSADEARLEPWIASAKGGNLASFAAGVKADKDAIAAAITEPWSSGQVERKVNHFKLIKRQMYGRANFDMLKARLMAAAQGPARNLRQTQFWTPIHSMAGALNFALFGAALWFMFRFRTLFARDGPVICRLFDRVAKWFRADGSTLRDTLCDGVVWLRAPRRRLSVLVGAVAAKLISATHYIWTGLAVGVVLAPFDYLFLMIFAGFSLVLSRFIRVPGSFVIGSAFAFELLGVPERQALLVILFNYVMSIVVVVGGGLIVLWQSGIDIRRVRKDAEATDVSF